MCDQTVSGSDVVWSTFLNDVSIKTLSLYLEEGNSPGWGAALGCDESMSVYLGGPDDSVENPPHIKTTKEYEYE